MIASTYACKLVSNLIQSILRYPCLHSHLSVAGKRPKLLAQSLTSFVAVHVNQRILADRALLRNSGVTF